MSCDKGFNPMRWDCAKRGCFNAIKRPKIELLADCLPGRIAFSDVDAIVEVCGNLLLIEWKDHQRLSTGQRVLFERLTRLCPATVLVVEGDAETMAVYSVGGFFRGEAWEAEADDLDGLRRRVEAWRDWALAHPALSATRDN
ncbi:MAG: hypothetical protein GC159_24200 [Phycisphaera sp.]|nr:hypothetical protein [Phycisphaera sp.]